MTPWVLTNPRRAWETRKIDFAPAFYILAVFFQMSESDALQETRNICSVITQATDNELQAFPRGVTEIGCLSIDSFMRKYRSWKQEKEKNAYLIEIEDILPAYSLSCINRNRLRKE